jgi:hypothetical protein
MYRRQGQGVFELAWTIFRVSMKGIFAVVALMYGFCAAVMVLRSGDLFRHPACEILPALASSLLMGLLVVSYVTLFLAIPVSACCAALALVITVIGRVSETVAVLPSLAARGRVSCPPGPPQPDSRIEVVETKVDVKEALCPVCSSAIETDLVSCLKCDAPHHEDCWDYVGCCATFGCGGTNHTKTGVRRLE